MTNVLFAAPYLMETTLRFVRAAASVDGVRLGLISAEDPDRLATDLREKLAGYWRAPDMLETPGLFAAARGLAGQMGGADRLLGVLEHIQTQVAEVREAMGIPGLGAEAAKNFRDKARMKEILRAAGLPCARHGLAGSVEEATVVAKQIGYPLVVKPPAGSGAVATFRVNDAQQLAQAMVVLAPGPANPALLEEFVFGEEHSLDCVVIDGRPVFHSISRYFPTPLQVLENPWIQWCVMLPRDIGGERYDAIRDAGFRAVRELGLVTGLSHMEWFRRGDGSIAISEAGARPPGAQFVRLISYAHDIDLYQAWARLMIHGQFEPPERKYAVGAAYLRAQGRGRIVAIHGLEEAQREVGPLVVESVIPRAGGSPTGTYEGEGYVIVRHPETEVVQHALSRIVSLIRVELA